MKPRFVLLTISLVLFGSCKNKMKHQVNEYDYLINNPATAEHPVDTINIPKLHFKEMQYSFGVARQGDTIQHIFKYYNTGKTTLLISDVSSSCSCAVPKIGKKQLEPGDSSELWVQFTTADKLMYQSKEFTIFANTFPPETKILLTGYVKQ